MATDKFNLGLQWCFEPDELSLAGGASVTELTDLSVNNRTLVGSSAFPEIKAGATPNGKKAVAWTPSRNPLAFVGDHHLNCIFLVVKIIGNFSGFNGIMSSPTSTPMLVGVPNSDVFYDNKYPFFEYRIDGIVQNPTEIFAGGDTVKTHNPAAPVDRWAIVYIRFWQKRLVEGIQFGQDRDKPERKANFELAFAAGYNRNFDDYDVRLMMRSLSWSFQVPLAELFPFNGSRRDEAEFEKIVLDDGQDEPVTHVKREARDAFAPNFGPRSPQEVQKVKAFYDYAYPGKSFYYRDFAQIPPRDTLCEFKPKTRVKYALDYNQSNYGLEFVQTTRLPAFVIPVVQPVIDAEIVPVIDSAQPTDVEDLTIVKTTPTTVLLDWKNATDVGSGIFGYLIQCSPYEDFSQPLPTKHLNSTTSQYEFPGLQPGTNYYFRVKAKDWSQLLSVNWSNIAFATTLVVAPPPSDYTVTNFVALRSLNAQSASDDNLVDFALTLITDLLIADGAPTLALSGYAVSNYTVLRVLNGNTDEREQLLNFLATLATDLMAGGNLSAYTVSNFNTLRALNGGATNTEQLLNIISTLADDLGATNATP